MLALTICPAQDNTILALLKSTFPAIKSTKNMPTPLVSPTTIAYIHALIIDSVTALQTDSATLRALHCETMARQELESMPLDEFHDELRLALTSYYEGIVKMEGASGVTKKVAYKRPIKRISLKIQEQQPPADSDAASAAAGAAVPAMMLRRHRKRL